jgi:amidase
MGPARIGELELKGVEKTLTVASKNQGFSRLLHKVGLVDTLVETSLKRTPFTQLANLTGQPAMSLPLYKTSSRLPVGVQVMASRGREDLLFQLAGELETASLWIDLKENPYWSKD